MAQTPETAQAKKTRIELLEEKKAKLDQKIKEEQQKEKERQEKALKKKQAALYAKVKEYVEKGWPDDLKGLKTEFTRILQED